MNYDRIFSQPMVRDYLIAGNYYIDEIQLKYIYDGYLYQMKEPRIRKSKTQKKIRQEFHALGHSKEEAQMLAKLLVKKATRIKERNESARMEKSIFWLL